MYMYIVAGCLFVVLPIASILGTWIFMYMYMYIVYTDFSVH